MTEQELRYELRQEGYSDDVIDAALETARAGLKA
jgi:SOS response regulatory protein OraA/RecX